MKMATAVEKFLKNKKNRPLIILIILFVGIYLYRRQKGKNNSAYTGGPYTGGNSNNGNNNGGNNNNGSGNVTIIPKSVLENNPGVFSKTVNGTLFEWIPTRYLDVEITEDERVILNCPVTKKAFDGGRDCKRFVFGDMYTNILSPEDQNLLFTTGLPIQEGNTAFYVGYFDANSLEEVRSNALRYIVNAANTGTGEQYSGPLEMVEISKTPATEVVPANRVRIPLQLQRSSWLPHYQLLTYEIDNFRDNAFGVTRYIAGVNKDTFGKKFSHIQYIYEWVLAKFGPAGLWSNTRFMPGQNEDSIADSQPRDKNYIMSAQIAEDLSQGDPSYATAERIFKRTFQRYQEEFPGITPDQTRIYSDYFFSTHGYELEIDFGKWSEAQLLPLTESPAGARKVWNVPTDDLSRDSYYFADAVNYRNYQGQAYIGNFLNTLGGDQVYKLLFHLEKYNLAASNRRHGFMGVAYMEGLHIDVIALSGISQRLKLNSGEIMRASAIPFGFHTIGTQAFWTWLLGNKADWWLWDSNIVMNTNPNTFETSWYGGYDAWKTRFRPNGATADQDEIYNQSNPSHPQRITGAENSQFPEITQQGDQGAFSYRYLYDQISRVKDYVSGGVSFAPFSYKINGGLSTPGYRGGNSPEAGSNGTRMNARGTQNPGQANSMKTGKDRKPIAVECTGADGGIWVVQNPTASYSTVTEYTLGGQAYEVRGARIEIIKTP